MSSKNNAPENVQVVIMEQQQSSTAGGEAAPRSVEQQSVGQQQQHTRGRRFLRNLVGCTISRDKPLDEGELKLWPLKFRHPKLERKYIAHTTKSLGFRLGLFSLINAIIAAIMWGSTAWRTTSSYEVDQSGSNFSQAGKDMANWAGHLMYSGCLLTYLFLWLSTLGFRLRPKTRHILINGVLLSHQFFVCIMIWVSLSSFRVLTVSASQETCLSLVFLLSLPVYAAGSLVCSRIAITWILYAIHFIVAAGVLSMLANKSNEDGNDAWQIASILCFGLADLLFLGGRYHNELRSRIDFAIYVRNQIRLKALHHEVVRLSPSRAGHLVQGESAVEELLALLKQAQQLVALASSKVCLSELLKTGEMIREVLQILSHGGDLFRVRFANLPEEGESIIDQYIWGKSLAKSHSNQTLERPQSLNSAAVSSTLSPDQFLPAARRASVPVVQQKTRKEVNYIRRRREKTDPLSNSAPLCSDDTQTASGIVSRLPKRASQIRSGSPQTSINSNKIQLDFLSDKVGQEWDFNILEFMESEPDIVVQVGASLLMRYLETLDIPASRLMRFLSTVEECYWDNPYHNKAHAATVAHCTCCLANMIGLQNTSGQFRKIAEIVYVVASLGHDVGHPSRNNLFFVNTFDPLAIIYNDVSVLENYHAFLTFQILDDEKCDIFQQLYVEVYREVRRRIIELILATDMKEHFETISKFRVRRTAPGFNMYSGDSEDLWQTIRILVKAADLSHGCITWNQHLQWSCRIQEEFYQQGDEEAALGYTKSPLCDRSLHATFAKSQKGFLEFVVMPLFTELKEADSSGCIARNCIARLNANKETWSALEQKGIEVALPSQMQTLFEETAEEEAELGTARRSYQPKHQSFSSLPSERVVSDEFSSAGYSSCRNNNTTPSQQVLWERETPILRLPSSSALGRYTNPAKRSHSDRRNVRWKPSSVRDTD